MSLRDIAFCDFRVQPGFRDFRVFGGYALSVLFTTWFSLVYRCWSPTTTHRGLRRRRSSWEGRFRISVLKVKSEKCACALFTFAIFCFWVTSGFSTFWQVRVVVHKHGKHACVFTRCFIVFRGMQIPVFVAVPAGGESQIGMSILEDVDFALSLLEKWKQKVRMRTFCFRVLGTTRISCFGGYALNVLSRPCFYLIYGA